MQNQCHLSFAVNWMVDICRFDWILLASMQCNLPPWSPDHSPEALAARPGTWRSHATRA